MKNIWFRNVSLIGLPILNMHLTIRRDKISPANAVNCKISVSILLKCLDYHWSITVCTNLRSDIRSMFWKFQGTRKKQWSVQDVGTDTDARYWNCSENFSGSLTFCSFRNSWYLTLVRSKLINLKSLMVYWLT